MPLTDQEKISNILKSKTYFQDQNQNIIVTILNDIKYLKVPKDVMIYDTTLRDGEQTPGVYNK